MKTEMILKLYWKLVVILLLVGSALVESGNSTTASSSNSTIVTGAKAVNVTGSGGGGGGSSSSTTLAPGTNASDAQVYKPFEGVDPNTLTCDPQGQIFLLLPHFSDCSKFFMCAHGEEVLFVCPGGLHFDFELQVCNWPRDTECILRDVPEDTEVEGSGEESFDWLSDGADRPSDGSLPSLTAEAVLNAVRPLSLEAPARAPGQSVVLNCLRADAAARRLPYGADCQRYWRCAGGVPRLAACADGLLFDELAQQCDHEANVRCAQQQRDELRSEFIAVK